MKKDLLKSVLFAGLFLCLAGISQVVQAQGVSLSYNYPADKAVKYSVTSTMAQIMDIEGQTMQTDVNSAFGCSVKSAGNQNGNFVIEVTVDTLGQTTSSPMGGAGGPVQGIKGKSCRITITPDGKIVDISGAEGLTFNIDGSGESNLSQTMSDFFPRLPATPVKAGDTWSYSDSTITKTPVMNMKVTDNAENKVEGFEKVNDIECVKIVTNHTGIMNMGVQAQGMDIYINGPYTGTSEYLFAVKEGYFVKLSSKTLLKGNLDLPSMGMNMPITIDTKSESVAK
jgi:hypothetical protein